MSTAHGATSANADDDDDPVIATFNVFLNPALLPGKRLLALGNGLRRDAHASTTSSNLDERDPTWGATPSEVRLKPKVGVMEMDVPRDVRNNYDHAKGIEMGTAMRIARDDGALNFFGEAGGMGVSAPPPQPRRKDRLTELGLSGQLEWDEAVKADQVLMQYTLAGKFVKEENKRSEHLIGIIQGDELHLTPLNSYVQLLPEKHQIAALRYVNRQNAIAAAKENHPNAKPQGRTIQMTLKSSNDNSRGSANDSPTAAFKAAAQEDWRKLQYVDENSQDAWDVFQETLVPLSEIKTDKARDGSPMDVDDNNEGEGRSGSALHDTIVTDLDKVPKLRTHLRAYHVNHKIARNYPDHYKTTHYYQEEMERLRARAIRRGEIGEQEPNKEEQQEPEPEPEVTRRGRPKGRGGASSSASSSKRGSRGGGRIQA